MTAHDWFMEHRVEYATGILDGDDAATFEAHLANCAECRAEISRIEAELAWLPMGLPPTPPRPGLRRRIVQHVLEGSGRPRRRWVVPAALAASILLALGAWFAGQQRVRALQSDLAVLEARAMALEDTLSVIRRAGRVLQTSVEVGDRRGAFVIFADETTHRWSVVVHGLPPAPPGSRYQFWFICADEMVPASEGSAAGPGSMMFTTGMPERGGAVLGAALTVEPVGSATGPPRGKPLAELML